MIFLVSLCAETVKLVFKGDKIWMAVEGNAPGYQVSVSCKSYNRWGERKVFKSVGAWVWTRESGEAGGGGGGTGG